MRLGILAWAFSGFHDEGELAEGWYQRKVAEKYGWDWFEELALAMYHMNMADGPVQFP